TLTGRAQALLSAMGGSPPRRVVELRLGFARVSQTVVLSPVRAAPLTETSGFVCSGSSLSLRTGENTTHARASMNPHAVTNSVGRRPMLLPRVPPTRAPIGRVPHDTKR